MGKCKMIIGIFLILVSIAGLFSWELKGREAILMDQVLVAKVDIQKGQKVSDNLFLATGVTNENKVDGAMTPRDLGLLQGKVASQLIVKNNQISLKFFQEEYLSLKKNESIYVINSEWIAMRSSSLRRGDQIDIYGEDGRGLIGTFQVAFVKDEAEREVIDAGTKNGPVKRGGPMDRTNSSSVIHHIEIIATMEQYQALVSSVVGDCATRLLIIQRGDQIAS